MLPAIMILTNELESLLLLLLMQGVGNYPRVRQCERRNQT